VHASQTGDRLAGRDGFRYEQRLDELIEPDMDLARERPHVLILPQATQIQGTHDPEMMPLKRGWEVM
jgi:hypothetical protein